QPPRSGDAWLANLGHELDLDSDVEGQLRQPDGGAGVAAGVAEHVDEEVRTAVDDRRGLVEARGAVDHTEDLHDPAHAVEAAELPAQGGQQSDADEPGGVPGRGEVEVPADLAPDHGAVGPDRAVAGQEEEVAAPRGGHVVA